MKMLLVLEANLERLAKAVIRRPKQAFWSALVIVALLTLGMSRMYIDVTNESMFREDDPALSQFREFQTQFGRDDAAVAAIASPNIFTAEFMEKLEAYHQDLEQSVPYLDKVTSLVSVTSITDRDGDLVIDDLHKVWPKSPEEFPEFRDSIVNNPLYRNLLISEEGDVTLVVVRANAFATEEQNETTFRDRVVGWHDKFRAALGDKSVQQGDSESVGADSFPDSPMESSDLAEIPAESKSLTTPQLQEFIHALKEVSDRHSSDTFPIRVAGGPVIAEAHAESIHADFAKLLPLAFLLVFVMLYLLLGTLGAAFIPILIVFLTLLATLGFMGWIGSPVTPVVVAIPPLILTIGVADAVHMMSSFYKHFAQTGDREESIIYACRRTGMAVVFTSLTTIGGFLSFMTADIKPIADFGIILAMGIVIALFLTLVMVPALLIMLKGGGKIADRRWTKLTQTLTRTAGYFSARSPAVLVGVVVLVIACVPGISKLHFSHNMLEWFEKDHTVRLNTLWTDKVFHGTIPLELVVDTGSENGLYSPEIMRRIEQFQTFAESFSAGPATMGRSTSIVDTLKRIHSVINQNNPGVAIPDTEEMVAQELLLFESSGADDVSELIDSSFSKARITIRMSWVDAVDYVPIRNRLEEQANVIFAGHAEVSMTGTIDLISRALVGIMQSMMTSYLIAAISIGLLMILLLRSVKFGLVSLIPNFLPIMVTLAIMGYSGIPIDMFSVLLGGIALGLAVDDTVHLMHGYRYHREVQGLSPDESIEQAILGCGPALVFTSISMALGFLVFVFSAMQALVVFGLILGSTIMSALFFDLLVTPSIIKMAERLGGPEFKQGVTKSQLPNSP